MAEILWCKYKHRGTQLTTLLSGNVNCPIIINIIFTTTDIIIIIIILLVNLAFNEQYTPQV